MVTVDLSLLIFMIIFYVFSAFFCGTCIMSLENESEFGKNFAFSGITGGIGFITMLVMIANSK